MALLEKYLVVKRSSIPGAGLGLFTTVDIPKDSLVVEYKGNIKTWKKIKNKTKEQYIYEYMYTINENRFIDASRTKKALARYANDASGSKSLKGFSNNCVFVNDGKKAFIQSVKYIPAGGEIFVKYGREYWEVKKLAQKKDRIN